MLVFGSALGPGLTGFLIDRGVSYPLQIAAMGCYCLAGAIACPSGRSGIRGPAPDASIATRASGSIAEQ